MDCSTFAYHIERWFEQNQRSLPWRETRNPYKIWISEIILQQTRVAQGYDYFLRFLQRFPSVEQLAEASEDEVLHLWQGLGYYSRARNIHAAAKMIVAAGAFPTTYDEILKLKGVGQYTAAAIASFAFKLPYAVLDGNVYRVLSRVFGINIPIDTTLGKHRFVELANSCLDRVAPDNYNQAIMDFGAIQCVPQQPLCDSCPLQTDCFAFSNHQVKDFPVKSKKTKSRERFFVYIKVIKNGKCLIHRRGSNDIWQGLYEPFLIVSSSKLPMLELLKHTELQKFGSKDLLLRQVTNNVRHILTHQRIFADYYVLHTSADYLPHGYQYVDEELLDNYAFPKLVHLLFQKENE